MPHVRPRWGWGLGHRGILAAVALLLASLLWLVAARGEPRPDDAPPPLLVVELNSAPPMVLLALPGLGPTRVDRIRSTRDERPIESLDDLAWRVKGIGPATIEGIRPFVHVDPSARDESASQTPR